MLPDYQNKIKMMTAINPAVFIRNVKTVELIQRLAVFTVENFSSILGEILPHSDFYADYCLQSAEVLHVCQELFYMFMGRDPNMAIPVNG